MTAPPPSIAPGPPLDPEQPGHGIGTEPPPAAKLPTKRLGFLGWTWVAIGAVVLVACVANAIQGPDRTPVPESDRARSACRTFVEDRLVAPGTAEYGTLSAVPTSSGVWVVSGEVTAQNRFAVPIRMEFTCRTHLDGDTWRLDSLSGLEG